MWIKAIQYSSGVGLIIKAKLSTTGIRNQSWNRVCMRSSHMSTTGIRSQIELGPCSHAFITRRVPIVPQVIISTDVLCHLILMTDWRRIRFDRVDYCQ